MSEQLTPIQQFVLVWLGLEEESLLGECNGAPLDDLLRLKLAEKKDIHLGSYAKVSLTEEGRRVLGGVSS